MVRKCSRCRKEGLACRVHISSGKCSACVRSNCKDCDVRISEREWTRLREQRRKLEEKREAARAARVAARSALERALSETRRAQEEVDTLCAREHRLEQEMDQLERREAEAISVEASALEELTEESDPVVGELALSPFTMSLTHGVPDDFWDSSPPEFLVSGGTVSAEVGSS